jgi:murein DD-endopeptidase MepM/ murein hydrolase activator NlpD
MRVYFRITLCCMLISLFLIAPCSGEELVKVSWSPETVKQGDVLCVTVRPENEVTSVKGDLDGTPIYFYKQNEGERAGIVGVDLATAPGRHYLRVEVTDPAGETFEQVFQLIVRDGGFEVQRLTLSEKMVTLQGEILERYLAEHRKTKQIFNHVRPQRLWQQPFIIPVVGPITSTFGLRRILNDKPRSPHSGVDIGAPTGTEVGACNDGIVVLTQELYLEGKTIIIDHGFGLYSIYMHLSEMQVNEGQWVRAGDVIGLVGATGRVTGPHLHWGVKLLGARVDPFSLMRAAVSGE